jgi:oxaloacetate decarboxylase (Na+ extruding) subunit alpha
MSEIGIVDTSLRAGNASVWGEKMNTAMMLEIAPAINRAGFKALDATAVSHFEYAVRYLRENPWERMRLLSRTITGAPLGMMMLGTSLNLFRHVMGPVMRSWMQCMRGCGMRRVQIMESSNNMADLAETARYAKEEGLELGVALVYTQSEVHTDDYYAQRARDALRLAPDMVYLKDPGGLLTLDRTRTIVPALQRALGDHAFEMHLHCTTGQAPLCYLEAARLGVRTFHTAVSPLANGPSQPAAESFLRNARRLGLAAAVDEKAIEEIAGHFLAIARAEGLPLGAPVEFDAFQFEHQVPGGVISNLKRQLEPLGAAHRLHEILEEVVRVRKDVGYPIMVTPFSQFVVTQATANIIQGERYRTVSDELIRFALGHHGTQVRPVDPELLDRIHDLPRTRDLLEWDPPRTSIEDLRSRIGASYSDEELLLLALVSEDDLGAMKAAGPLRTQHSATGKPLAAFIRELGKHKRATHISIQREGFSLTLRRAAPDDAQ